MNDEQTATLRFKRSLPKQSFRSSTGARVGRVSVDGCWPLRRANGRTWAEDRSTSWELYTWLRKKPSAV